MEMNDFMASSQFLLCSPGRLATGVVDLGIVPTYCQEIISPELSRLQLSPSIFTSDEPEGKSWKVDWAGKVS